MYLNKEPNPTTRNPTSTSSTKTLKLGATLPTPLSPSNSFQNRPGWNLAKSPFKAEKFRGQEHYDGNKFSRANIVAVVVFGQRREIERRPPQRLHVRIYLYLYIYTYMHSRWLMRARCTENPFPPGALLMRAWDRDEKCIDELLLTCYKCAWRCIYEGVLDISQECLR